MNREELLCWMKKRKSFTLEQAYGKSDMCFADFAEVVSSMKENGLLKESSGHFSHTCRNWESKMMNCFRKEYSFQSFEMKKSLFLAHMDYYSFHERDEENDDGKWGSISRMSENLNVFDRNYKPIVDIGLLLDFLDFSNKELEAVIKLVQSNKNKMNLEMYVHFQEAFCAKSVTFNETDKETVSKEEEGKNVEGHIAEEFLKNGPDYIDESDFDEECMSPEELRQLEIDCENELSKYMEEEGNKNLEEWQEHEHSDTSSEENDLFLERLFDQNKNMSYRNIFGHDNSTWNSKDKYPEYSDAFKSDPGGVTIGRENYYQKLETFQSIGLSPKALYKIHLMPFEDAVLSILGFICMNNGNFDREQLFVLVDNCFLTAMSYDMTYEAMAFSKLKSILYDCSREDFLKLKSISLKSLNA